MIKYNKVTSKINMTTISSPKYDIISISNQSQKLEKRRDFGVIFEVTNQKGVKSYLVGTCHTVNKESTLDPAISEIIEKCAALYSELGINHFISAAQGSMPEEAHPYQYIPLRYSYDIAITLAAWCKKVPIISLDKGIPYRDKQLAEARKKMQEEGIDKFEQSFMKMRAKSSCNPESFRTLNAWKNSNIACLKRCRDDCLKEPFFDQLVTQREEYWVKTLIPKLLNTEQPIAIAVGAAHVVGDNSLSERFARAGLKVELISSGLTRIKDMPAKISTLPAPRSRF